MVFTVFWDTETHRLTHRQTHLKTACLQPASKVIGGIGMKI